MLDRIRPALAAVVAFAGLALPPAPDAAAQTATKDQAGCLLTMNKGGAKLVKTQLKDAAGCVKSAGKGATEDLGLPGQTQTAEACLTNDVKGKVVKAQDKVTDKDLSDCLDAPEQLPPWSYEGAAAVNLAATDEPLSFVGEVFGPDLDAAIVDADGDSDGAKCQQTVAKDGAKFIDTLWKVTLKAMKTGLKCNLPDPSSSCIEDGIPSIASRAEFETYSWGAVQTDAKGKVLKKATKLVEKIADKCADAATDLASMFPGACAGAADTDALGLCVEEIARRRQCRSLNGVDGFLIDCGGTPDEITLSPATLDALTRETRSLTVMLNTAAGPSGFDVDLSSDAPAVAGVPASVSFAEGERTKNVDVTTGVVAGSATISASAPDTDGDDAGVDVSLRTLSLVSPLVGIGRTVDGRIVLDDPAPSGDAWFAMSSDDESTVTVDSPVVVAAGQTEQTFGLTGHQTGFPTLTADGSADGYEIVMLALEATNRLVDLSSGETLAMGIPFTLPVLIAPDPAPSGGVAVTVETSDAGIVEVNEPTVTVPSGQLIGFGTITATAQTGAATITASNFGYAPDVMPVTVESGLKIVESFSEFGEFETDSVFLRLQQQGEPFPVPAGGAAVSLVADDPDCVAVAAMTTLPETTTFHTVDLSYGGSAALPCTTVVTADSPVYGADTVTVTVGAVADLGALTVSNPFTGATRVGAGLQQQFRATMASSAHGGVLVQIETDDPTVALVAPDQTTPGQPVIEVPVPAGTAFVNFYVQGGVGATGPATLLAQQGRFTDGTAAIDIEQPVLDLAQLFTNYNVDATDEIADDDFYVRTGLPTVAGTTLQYEQQVSAAAGALDVTVANADPSLAALQTALVDPGTPLVLPIAPGASRTPTSFTQGGFQLDYPHPPVAGTNNITATAPGFDGTYPRSSLDIDIVVNTPTISVVNSFSTLVGAGLQAEYRVTLSGSSHGGVTVRVTSSDPGLATVAADTVSTGGAFADVVFADGDASEFVYVNALPAVTGAVTLTATEPSHTDGVRDLDVVQPVADLISIQTSHATISTATIADDPIYARIGVPSSGGTGIGNIQPVSPHLPGGIDLTFASTDTSIAELATSGSSGMSIPLHLDPGESQTPTTVAAGGVALRYPVPPVDGTTTVSVSGPGFDNTFNPADEDVTVSVTQATLTVSNPFNGADRVGASLQQQLRVTLSGSSHGGVTVRVTSDDPSVATVAPDASTAGTAFIDVPVANGTTFFNFYVQGVAGQAGSVTLTANEGLHTDGTLDLEVTAPVLDLLSLGTSYATVSTGSLADDQFNARTGAPNAAGSAIIEQPVSAAVGAGMDITFASSDTAIAEIATSAASGSSAVVNVPAGSSRTPATLATGGVATRFPTPPADGTTTVSATAVGADNGFDPADEDVTVSVTQATLTVANPFNGADRVGASLQQQLRVTLSGSAHGGVTVRVTSDDPAVATVAPDATTAGTAFIDVAVPNGTSVFHFYVHGIAAGPVTLTATEAAHTSGNFAMTVVAPVFDLLSLQTAPSTTAISVLADDPFQVRSGVPNAAGTAFGFEQGISATAGTVDVTVSSSATSIAEVATSGGAGASAMVTLGTDDSRTPATLGTGGFALRFPVPPADGTTTVAATATGFDALFDTSDDDVTVTVDPATLSLSAPTSGIFEVGAGLQHPLRVQVNGSSHGGVTVRIAVSDPNLALVTDDDTVVGTSFIDLVLAEPSTSADFFIQGVGGESGTINLNASSVGYVDGDEAIDVTAPVLDILSLGSTTTAGAADDAFQVRTGIPNAAGTGFQREQDVSPEGAVTITLTSSAPAVGQLTTTASTGASVDVTVAPGSTRSASSVAGGGVAFDPLTAGSTDVQATAPGFTTPFPLDTQTVTVNP